MQIKDRLTSWYLRNILIPKQQVIEHPGYLVKQLRGAQYNRSLLLPEKIIIGIEEGISSERGDKGSRELYSVGKNFGVRFSIISDLTTVESRSKDDLRKFAHFLTKYIESIYSSSIEEEIDLDKSKFSIRAEDYIVCRVNGRGYIFSSGGVAGIWSYVMRDSSIEGVQTSCQGRGDEYCEIVCAPSDVLKEMGLDFSEYEVQEDKLGTSERYEEINKIRETNYAETSLQDFIDIDFFDYSGGKITHGEDRYILSEASLIYLLARELSEVEDGEAVLFDSAFKYGRELAEEEEDREMEKFIREYLSACGWGDTLIKEKDDKFKVYGFLFPWTKFWEETSFPVYRGLVSGLLSGYAGREVRLDGIEKDIKGEGFTVIASEK